MVAALPIVAGVAIPSPVVERFLRRFDTGDPSACWPWPGPCTPAGYGRVRFQVDRVRTEVYAHRIAFAIANGDIPVDLVVRHDCDNPPCCNPAHLRLGTQADNVRDRDDRGRHRTNAPRGEASGTAKLTDASVLLIRRAYAAGIATQREIGDAFGVSFQEIGAIVRGDKWSHASGPRTHVGTGYAARRGLAVAR